MIPFPRPALGRAALAALLLPLAAAAGDHPPVANIVQVHAFQQDEGHDGRTALVESRDGGLYGVTIGGGAGPYFHGALFRVGREGKVAMVAGFSGDTEVGGQPGSTPVEGDDDAIYGTTQLGGAHAYGTVWRFDKATGALSALHAFVPNDPNAIVSNTFLTLGRDGWLYGASQTDGAQGRGYLFRLRNDGSKFQVLHDFTGGDDGAEPASRMVQAHDGAFYGTARSGAFNDCGVIYKLTASAGFEVLNPLCTGGDFDPSHPDAELIGDPEGNFYGTSEFGGAYGGGTIFRRNVDGSIDTLKSFLKGKFRPYGPSARLALDKKGNLYGVTRWGGENAKGTIFRLDPKHGFNIVHAFGGDPKPKDGRYPWGPLTHTSDGRFFGMTAGGGPESFFGTVYELEEE